MKQKINLILLAMAAAMMLISCGNNGTAAAVEEKVESAPAAEKVSTVDTVKDRGYLIVGVNASNPGFSYLDPDGNYLGFEADMGRSIAAAVLGDPEKIQFRPLTSKERFAALQSGEIDLLIRTATHTMTRDTDLSLDFSAPYYYDGQTFMVRKDSGIKSIADLEGASICVLTGSTSEGNLSDIMASRNLSYKPVLFENLDELMGAFEKGRADAWTGDRSGLMTRMRNTADPSAYTLLDETISKEPLAIGVRHGDDQWSDIINWSLNGLFFAEEHGITSANIDSIKSSTEKPEEMAFLGLRSELGSKLGLSNDWAYNMIKKNGNYGELFDRHFGPDSGLSIPRGFNKPWTDGGLLYSPPFR